ncbi:hypothetical protein ACF0H5_005600 [Mactra antiquata]
MLQDDIPNLLQDRDDVMKEKIKRMSKGELEDLCLQMVSSHPELVFNILKSDTSQSGGFHPPSGGNIPDWCLFNCCRQMPKDEEKVCCGYKDCISLLPVSILHLTACLHTLNIS